MNTNSPKVSVVIPIYNTEQYLDECMQSVVNQTLNDIEIICVNDGSTDRSLEIAELYAKNDTRVKVISKTNSGYGNTMNIGFENASGEYIGIVESDDFAAPEMFETLYNIAKKYDVEVVKSNYYAYKTEGAEKTFMEVMPKSDLNKIINPIKNQNIFRVRPCIWAAIYKKEFVVRNNIKFNETEGASYQDASFNFKIWASAKKVYFIQDAFLHYRIDNTNSSVKSMKKVFCICDEYREIEDFLDKNPDKKEKLEKLKNALKYEQYRWNLDRLTPDLQRTFLIRMYDEFSKELANGKLEKDLFPKAAWEKLCRILDDPEKYLLDKQVPLRIIKVKEHKEVLAEQVKVSVIVPIYNAEEYLSECLDSIINQTLEDIEIICINDGSPDSSIDILNEYARKDRRIKIINQENKGVGQARNVGINAASGEYVIFIDPDDWYPTNNVLSELYKAAKKNNVLICGGSFSSWLNGKVNTKYLGQFADNTFNVEGLTKYSDYQFDYSYQRFVFYRKMLIEKKIYFPSYTRFQDPPFFIKAMIEAGEFYAIKMVVYRYRRGHQQIKWNNIKTCDLLKGLIDDLTLSKDNGLAKLHALTVLRINSDYFKPIMDQLILRNLAVFSLLIKANNTVSIPLLRKNGMQVSESFLLEPLNQLLNCIQQSKNEKIDQKSYRIGRAITFIPRVLMRFICGCKTYGIKDAIEISMHKVSNKLRRR